MIRKALLISVILGSAVVFAAEGVIGAHRTSCKDDPEIAKRVAQYRAAGEPVDVSDLHALVIADQDNAVIEIQRAAEMSEPENGKNAAWKQYENGDRGYPMTAKERPLATKAATDNAQIIPLLDQAMAKKGFLWMPQLSSPLIDVALPELRQQRYLACFLDMQALLDHQAGRDAEAIKDIQRNLFLVHALGHDKRFLVVTLVASGIDGVACDTVRKIEPTLAIGKDPASAAPGETAKLINELLDEGDQIGGSYRDALFGERVGNMDTADAIANGRFDVSKLGTPRDMPPLPDPSKAMELVKSSMLGDLPPMLDYTTRVADAIAAPNWPAAEQMLPKELSFAKDPTKHLFGTLIAPSLSRSVEIRFRVTADLRAAATVLAIRWYQADHNQSLPATLEALVPKYLPALPADPFATDNKPLHYIPDGPDPRIYSLSPDGTDGGGKDRDADGKRLRPSPKWAAVYHLMQQPRDLSDLPADLKD